jgi:hypothetical protein
MLPANPFPLVVPNIPYPYAFIQAAGGKEAAISGECDGLHRAGVTNVYGFRTAARDVP